MKMRSQILVLTIVAIAAGSATLRAQSDSKEKPGNAPAKTKVYKFRSVDYPGGSGSEATDYEGGIVVGGTAFGDGTGVGFAYHGTTFRVIAYPGSLDTAALAINASGTIAGQYQDVNLVVHGFLFDGKTYTTIDPPGSTSTEVEAINESGVMVGNYVDGSHHQHGFIDTDENSPRSIIRAPRPHSAMASMPRATSPEPMIQMVHSTDFC